MENFLKMKSRSLSLLTAFIFLLTSCGNDKAAANETQSADNSKIEKKEAQNNVASPAGEGIVGG
jgi:PBP1b-binding outer membrane lipoprotein LpoB